VLALVVVTPGTAELDGAAEPDAAAGAGAVVDGVAAATPAQSCPMVRVIVDDDDDVTVCCGAAPSAATSVFAEFVRFAE